jgi:hypothetical protein
MTLDEMLKKYKLTVDVDCWKHPQGNFNLLTHDACLKIAHMENIVTTKIESLQCLPTHVTLLITMSLGDKTETTVGEASKDNVKMQGAYYGCMAEKRGKDRAILQLIGEYDNFKSEIEAEEWEVKSYGIKLPSKASKEFLLSLCVKHQIDNSQWDWKLISQDVCSKLIDAIKKGRLENVNQIIMEA